MTSVGDRRAGIKPAHGAGDDRCLCRSAPEVTQKGEGNLDEIIARPSLFEDRTKENKKENQRGRNAESNAEDAFVLHPEMPHRLAVGRALPLHRFRQRAGVAEEDIKDKEAGNDDQGQAQNAVDGDEKNDHADCRDDQIARCRQPGAHSDLVPQNDDIETGHDAEACKHPVIPGDPVLRAAFEKWKGEGRQQEAERQMVEPRVGICDDAESRCFPELGRERSTRYRAETAPRSARPKKAARSCQPMSFRPPVSVAVNSSRLLWSDAMMFPVSRSHTHSRGAIIFLMAEAAETASDLFLQVSCLAYIQPCSL